MKLDPTRAGWLRQADEAFGRAIAEAIAEHKRVGNPIYYRRKGVAGIVKEMADGTCYEVQRDENKQEIIIRELPSSETTED